MDYPIFIKNALVAASTGDKNKLTSYFHADATFFLQQSPYRIEGLEQYSEILARLQTLGSNLQYLHIRQPDIISLCDNSTLVTFHFASRILGEGIPLAFTGYGTAIVVTGMIRHLHLSRNGGGSGNREVDDSSAALSLAGVAPTSLNQMSWSDSPDL